MIRKVKIYQSQKPTRGILEGVFMSSKITIIGLEALDLRSPIHCRTNIASEIVLIDINKKK